jgi:hypothetical protein
MALKGATRMRFGYLLAAAIVAPISAQAAGLKPGLYVLNKTQEICLQAAGTWYSPTLSGWTHIFGNYDSGTGNDSIVVKGKSASWTEWKDGLGFQNVVDPASFEKSGSCT